ncbi:MAG: flavin reductase family protein [Peptococcaceae bacterium]|jgi:flavin reductase (DIM6/NTAB) family NADH-FMN oxidoreductase RutF|nr:flavin reductase family protein [Peptococcaceae bacterium]
MEKIKLENLPVGPFPGMIVGALRNKKPTYTTVGAGGCACLEPVLCVSLKNTHYITEGIRQTGYFSVNIPATEWVREMDYCGMVSGHQVDKSTVFTSFFDPAGAAPLISECSLNFLCRVCDTKEIRGFTMFFGDVTAVYANADALTAGRPDPLKIDPIILLGGSYCCLGQVIGQPFSEGKKLNR